MWCHNLNIPITMYAAGHIMCHFPPITLCCSATIYQPFPPRISFCLPSVRFWIRSPNTIVYVLISTHIRFRIQSTCISHIFTRILVFPRLVLNPVSLYCELKQVCNKNTFDLSNYVRRIFVFLDFLKMKVLLRNVNFKF